MYFSNPGDRFLSSPWLDFLLFVCVFWNLAILIKLISTLLFSFGVLGGYSLENVHNHPEMAVFWHQQAYSFLFLSRVEIIVRKKKISHSTNPTSQTGSYYCVNRLHPSWNLCKGWFSSANSTIAKEDRSISYAPLNYSVS